MNWLTRTTIYGLAAGLVLALGVTYSPREASAGWAPKKPVEFIIMNEVALGIAHVEDRHARGGASHFARLDTTSGQSFAGPFDARDA